MTEGDPFGDRPCADFLGIEGFWSRRARLAEYAQIARHPAGRPEGDPCRGTRLLPFNGFNLGLAVADPCASCQLPTSQTYWGQYVLAAKTKNWWARLGGSILVYRRIRASTS